MDDLGVDGAWVGATHGNSYLPIQLNPGVYHIGTSWQFSVALGIGRAKQTAAAHFTVEAGGVYHRRSRGVSVKGHSGLDVTLQPLDSDEGRPLANKFSISESHPRQ